MTSVDAERRERLLVELDGAREIGDRETDVIDHARTIPATRGLRVDCAGANCIVLGRRACCPRRSRDRERRSDAIRLAVRHRGDAGARRRAPDLDRRGERHAGPATSTGRPGGSAALVGVTDQLELSLPARVRCGRTSDLATPSFTFSALRRRGSLPVRLAAIRSTRPRSHRSRASRSTATSRCATSSSSRRDFVISTITPSGSVQALARSRRHRALSARTIRPSSSGPEPASASRSSAICGSAPRCSPRSTSRSKDRLGRRRTERRVVARSVLAQRRVRRRHLSHQDRAADPVGHRVLMRAVVLLLLVAGTATAGPVGSVSRQGHRDRRRRQARARRGGDRLRRRIHRTGRSRGRDDRAEGTHVRSRI